MTDRVLCGFSFSLRPLRWMCFGSGYAGLGGGSMAEQEIPVKRLLETCFFFRRLKRKMEKGWLHMLNVLAMRIRYRYTVTKFHRESDFSSSTSCRIR